MNYSSRASNAARNAGIDPQGKPRLTLRYGAEAAQPNNDKTALVRGILYIGSITLISGAPKSGKSFLATDLFRAVADVLRALWMGHPVRAHGPVLYVACEGHGGFWKRLRAGGPVPDNFVLATGRPVLIETDDHGRTYAPHPDDILAAIEEVKARLGLPPIAVAIDTVFRSFGSGNVNASDHMNAYVGAATQLADLGMAVLLVHHETKSNNTPAGSISLTGAADVLIRTEKLKDGSHSWCVDDAKDDAATKPRTFRLDPIDVGTDSTEEPVTSCKVTDMGEDATANNGPDIPPSRRPFYDALIGAITRSDRTSGRCTLKQWEDEALRRGAIEQPSAGETSRERGARLRDFRKAKSDLLAAKWIIIDGEIVADLKGRWA
jgi:hypothetical protein